MECDRPVYSKDLFIFSERYICSGAASQIEGNLDADGIHARCVHVDGSGAGCELNIVPLVGVILVQSRVIQKEIHSPRRVRRHSEGRRLCKRIGGYDSVESCGPGYLIIRILPVRPVQELHHHGAPRRAMQAYRWNPRRARHPIG